MPQFTRVLCVAFIVFVIYAVIKSEKEWQAFSADHACKLMFSAGASRGVGASVTSFVPVNMVSAYTRGKEGWMCNDGKIYWR